MMMVNHWFLYVELMGNTMFIIDETQNS